MSRHEGEARLTAASAPGGQTTGQWAMRWHGVLLFVALIGSVPLVHLGWCLLRDEPRPVIRTNSQVPAPEWRWESFRDGSWMQALARYLREDSPIVWALRGAYNEARYALGVLQNDKAHVGRDGWLFLRATLDVDPGLAATASELRRARLAEIRTRAARLGVVVFAVPVPDKVRIYPEFAFSSGRLPPSKEASYRAILADLDAAGIPHLDAATLLRQARVGAPSVLLFYRRDTHWTSAGAAAVAQAVAARLENSEWAARLGPRAALTLGSPRQVEVVPDIAALLGLRTWSDYRPELGISLTRPASLVSSSLLETKEYWSVVQEGAVPEPPAVALAGSSFSVDNGRQAFSWFLRRVLDERAVWNGASPWEAIDAALGRIEAGESSARLLLWEFVERSLAGAFPPP